MNRWEKAGKKCENCGSKTDLTRHHLKNMAGKRNGKFQILCKTCHREAEESYRLLGILEHPRRKYYDGQTKHRFEEENPIIPFYARKNNGGDISK